MRITRLKIKNKTLDEVVNFLIQHLHFGYESNSPKMAILIDEIYEFDTNYITRVLVARDMETEIHLDIISNPMDFSTLEIFKNQEPKLSKKVKWILDNHGPAAGIFYMPAKGDN